MTARKLKNLFDANLVHEVASDLSRADPDFDAAGFVESGLDGLDRLELTARAWHLAEALQKYLPQPFSRAADVLVASLGPELPRTDEFGLSPLRYMPHVFFVQKYGLDDFEAAMRVQYELTKRFSAESSIRVFLARYPGNTYARLLEWARDENVHVRRLVSEGTRPRLPWAPRLRAFQEDARPVIALLELLKDDPERYVQRSVANNLNDIGKDHPDLAVEVCRRWSTDASPGREWIVRHALRSLVKKAHRGALETLGVGGKPNVRVTGVRLVPPSVKLGGELRFSFEIASSGKRVQELLINYAVHFVKANGATRPKVFKLRKIVLSPSARVELGSTVSFENMTTRRHYPGRHRIDVLINGVAHPLAEFEVRTSPLRLRGLMPTPA
ncbi:MAG: DNA alkylation repair protein [Acidobacteria bacterium]|nr:DNA alkylation repair protein [Acidobacteriota bacterium]